MKKNLLTLLFACCALSGLWATHIVGGSMFHTYVDNNTWRIQLDMYRDCVNGEPYFDFSIPIGVFDEMGNLVIQTEAWFDFEDDTLNLENSPICFPLPYEICVHRGRYVFELDLPPTGQTYRVVYQRCCRNVLVQNLINPLDLGMTFMTTIRPQDQNNSAKLNNPLPFQTFANVPFVYEAGATDPDGDSLVYYLTAPLGGAGNCSSCPSSDPTASLPNPPSLSTMVYLPYPAGYSSANILGDGPQPLTIDHATGRLTAQPSEPGYYVIGFEIDEYRNGERITSNHHEIMLVVNDGYYEPHIGGRVFHANATGGTQYFDSADVQLIVRDRITDSLMLIRHTGLTDGTYLFDSVFTSKYLVRAVPTPGSAHYQTTFPTFHYDKYFWYNASELEVCDASVDFANIIVRTDSLAYAPEDADFFLKGKIVDPLAADQPVTDYEVWLMAYKGTKKIPIRWTKTNQLGEFAFEKLPYRSYDLFVNELNSANNNQIPPQFTVNKLTTRGLTVLLDRYPAQLKIRSIEAEAVPKPNPHLLWPNPAVDEVFLNVPKDFQRVEIFDIAGRLVERSTDSIVSVKTLPSGTYWVHVHNKSGSTVAKLIKI
jgi:hypothetical protein